MLEEYQSKGNEGKRHKPAKNHPWRRALTTEQHKWALEQSKISELTIKQPKKFSKRD